MTIRKQLKRIQEKHFLYNKSGNSHQFCGLFCGLQILVFSKNMTLWIFTFEFLAHKHFWDFTFTFLTSIFNFYFYNINEMEKIQASIKPIRKE